MSLDAQGIERLVLQYTAFVYSVCADVGFRDEDLKDAVYNCWAELWADRHDWPAGGPQNEIAYLRTHVYRTACDEVRAKNTQKRGARTVSIHRKNGGDPANEKNGSAFRFMQDYDDSLDRALVDHAIRVVASTLSIKSEAVILSFLDDGPSFDKITKQRATRNFRRALDLPISSPQRAAIGDMDEHVIRAARRIATHASHHLDDIEITQEITCGTVITSTINHESASPMSGEHRRSGAAEPSQTQSRSSDSSQASPTSRGSARTPSSRSRLPPSVSARSRRPVPSTATIATPACRAVIRRPDRTVITRRPAMFEEDSLSGSHG